MERYARQITLPEVGLQGQRALSESSVAIIGCGGLGHPAALILAGAGLGELNLVDSDFAEMNNLHRQFAFSESDIGKNKAEALAMRLRALNSMIKIKSHAVRLTKENVFELLGDCSVVLDCSDDIPTRYLLSDACVYSGKVLVSASIHRNEGMLSVFNFRNGPTYRCFFPSEPESADNAGCEYTGVSAVTTSMLGSMQAGECMKVILGSDDLISGRILLIRVPDYEIEFIGGSRLPEATRRAAETFEKDVKKESSVA